MNMVSQKKYDEYNEVIEKQSEKIDSLTNKVKDLRIENDIKTKELIEMKQNNKIQSASRGRGIIPAPSHTSSFKSYMDYRKITNKSSEQYKIQMKSTTNKQGFRVKDGKYLIALGTGFGKVGDVVKVNLENGSFDAIIGDTKANNHTDPTNKFHLSDGSVLEFIVDKNSLERNIKLMGDCSYASYPNLKGKVKNIQNLSK